jgi:hypothetical protein
LFQRRTARIAGVREIEMNEYEIICKGTVIIGSLRSGSAVGS